MLFRLFNYNQKVSLIPDNSKLPLQRTNHKFGRVYHRASLTLEATFALPLTMMFVAILLTIVSSFGSLCEENLKLTNEARSIAMYAAIGENSSPEWIDITKPVSIKIPFGIASKSKLNLTSRARVRSWIGSNGAQSESDKGDDTGTYYLSDYGSVYHTHADCTHLDLTIIETTTDKVSSLRNEYGQKYKKCDGFPKDYTGTVYVTSKGDRYYPSTDYAGLTRHVHVVGKDEISGLHICERCANRDL